MNKGVKIEHNLLSSFIFAHEPNYLFLFQVQELKLGKYLLVPSINPALFRLGNIKRNMLCYVILLHCRYR